MGPLARASLLVEAHDSRRTRREITALVEKDRSEVAIVQNVFPLISPSVYDVLQRRGIRVLQAVYNYRLVSPAGELFSRGEICERSLGGNYLHCVARRCYRGSAVMSAWYASILGLHRRRRTFARLIDCFLVPDAFMANKLSEGGLPAERMQPIVSPFFVREHAPSETHDGYVAFVGRLVAHKGVRTLIEAARLAGPNCRVVLVGTGELEGEVRARIARDGLDGRVRLLGPRWGDELRTIVRGAAAVAIPSEWYDNLPLVLCQANASGKPVLASRINGIPEYVHDGENGFLFEPGDARGLARLMDRIVGMPSAEYAAIARSSRTFAERSLDFDAHYATLSAAISRLRATA